MVGFMRNRNREGLPNSRRPSLAVLLQCITSQAWQKLPSLNLWPPVTQPHREVKSNRQVVRRLQRGKVCITHIRLRVSSPMPPLEDTSNIMDLTSAHVYQQRSQSW